MTPIVGSIAVLLVASGLQASAPDSNAKPTSVKICRVLEAAYTATVLAPSLNNPGMVVHPSSTVPDDHPLAPLATWTAKYKNRLGLEGAEFDDLAIHQQIDGPRHYQPNCKWRGEEKNNEEAGFVYDTSLSWPVFSRDGQSALTQVSFYHGQYSYGLPCLLRNVKSGWVAHCITGWATLSFKRAP